MATTTSKPKKTTQPKGKPTPKRPTKVAPARTVDVEPGHPDFDWRSIYPDDVELTRYVDPEHGTVLCLPPFPEPDQGSIFADLLEDIPDQVMLMRLCKQALQDNATDPAEALRVTAAALRKGLTSIQDLLTAWSGVDLPK